MRISISNSIKMTSIIMCNPSLHVRQGLCMIRLVLLIVLFPAIFAWCILTPPIHLTRVYHFSVHYVNYFSVKLTSILVYWPLFYFRFDVFLSNTSTTCLFDDFSVKAYHFMVSVCYIKVTEHRYNNIMSNFSTFSVVRFYVSSAKASWVCDGITRFLFHQV